ncbi:MAG TPA: hypothetical protein VGK97_03635 [Spongiibacteraceae bacterium]
MKSDVLNAAPLIRVAAKNPEVELEALLQQFSHDDRSEILLAVDFEFCEYWRDEKPTVALTALFHLQRHHSSIATAAAVLRTSAFEQCSQSWQASTAAINNLLNSLPVTVFPLNSAMQLQPVAIPKPWGREIWYTGIEKRGVAEVGEMNRSVPLPWLIAIAPQRLLGGVQQPILLKILDPLPEPIFGDLYFELHREKQEVYVVTAIDRSAWPDGAGAIRFGFDSAKRREYADDKAFVNGYLFSVQTYRALRQQIDEQIDTMRVRDGVGLNDPVSAATLRRWHDEIKPELHASEAALRAEMESFTALLPLRVGDVIKVPCLLPHSLQHGVRTVEFQTPVYERLILSFAQKVLTQTDWDTDEAATVLQLDPEPAAAFLVTATGAGWTEEQIVVFDDFEVRRLTLAPMAELPLTLQRSYGLGMAVGQGLLLGDQRLEPDTALLLPSGWQASSLRNSGDHVSYFLLAQPLR